MYVYTTVSEESVYVQNKTAAAAAAASTAVAEADCN